MVAIWLVALGSVPAQEGNRLDPGDIIEVNTAFDAHETEYELEITPIDLCQEQSDPVF